MGTEFCCMFLRKYFAQCGYGLLSDYLRKKMEHYCIEYYVLQDHNANSASRRASRMSVTTREVLAEIEDDLEMNGLNVTRNIWYLIIRHFLPLQMAKANIIYQIQWLSTCIYACTQGENCIFYKACQYSFHNSSNVLLLTLWWLVFEYFSYVQCIKLIYGLFAIIILQATFITSE